MRILAVSVAPLFPDRVTGGSQRILIDVADALAEAGHTVRVLCSRSPGGGSGFETPNGASIEPSLELRGAFPAPYQTAPHRLQSVWQRLSEGASWAGRAYLHADAVYMRSALGDLPVIRSLHDFVYEEALLSAFTLPAARTIVPSQYLKDCIVASAGRVADQSEIIVIPNGVAVPQKPVEPRLPAGLRPLKPVDLVLLHPHRLHREKGIEQSMLIAAEVQRRLPERNVRLLVPALRRDGSPDDAALADGSVLELAESTGAEKLLELHSWLDMGQMPGYYSAGHVTLCPGSFVEAFGLVPLESVAAGTPAVCAMAGAFREQQGVEGIWHFDYGDISAATDAVIEAVSQPYDAEQAARGVTGRYDIGRMRAAYVEAVTGALPPGAGADTRRTSSATEATGWRLAPWCYQDRDRIYHDYLAGFDNFPLLAAMLRDSGTRAAFTADRTSPGFNLEFDRARKHGFIVPA